MILKVYIRADGSTEIGLGHLIRCIALGHMLKGDFEVHFVCREIPDSIKDDIIRDGFLFQAIDREEEFLESLTGAEIVVIDNYRLNISYQKKIKSRGSRLIIIDDLHENGFFADLIINHSPGVGYKDYEATAITQYALGSEFVLLRPPFLQQAKAGLASDTKRNVLICFGGADFKNLTMQTLMAVLDFEEIKEIVAVTGAAYQHQKELTLVGSPSKKIRFYNNISADKMAELISESDIAIVPSSGILLETLAVGNDVVSGMYIENQKLIFENFRKINAFYNAGDFSQDKVKIALKECLSTTGNNDRIIDGNSSKRILKIFKQMAIEQEIHMRKAKIADLSLTYKWAADRAVRAFSFNQDEIKPEGHAQWFLTKVQDHRCLYLIAEMDEKEIGSLRFDIEGKEAVISYLLDPEFHKKGLSVPLLKRGLEYLLCEEKAEIRKIIGFVIPENVASCKTFERFGFGKTLEGGNYKYTLLIN